MGDTSTNAAMATTVSEVRIADSIPMLYSDLDVKTHDSYHNTFIGYAVDAVRRIVGKAGLAYDERNLHIEKASPDMPDVHATPDVTYSDGNDMLVVCEAKANRPDMTGDTVVNQVRNELMILVGSDARERHFVLSTPFCFENTARGVLSEAMGKIGRANLAGIGIEWCCELSDRKIDAPDVVRTLDDAERRGAIGTQALGKRVTERVVSIYDLLFDETNARIVRSDDEGHRIHGANGHDAQEECYRRLLACGYNDMPQAESRRREQMIDAGTIIERPMCYEDEDGRLVVFDGNSRVALARHIIEVTGHHAAGYEHVLVYDFGRIGDTVTEKDIIAYKDGKQHQQVVQHGLYSDAFQIYSEYGKFPVSEIAISKQCTESIVHVAYQTISYMLAHGWNDRRMHDSYEALSAIVGIGVNAAPGHSPENWQSMLFTKNWKEQGVTLDAVIEKLTSPSTSGQWRAGRKHAVRLAKYGIDRLPAAYKVDAVRSFLDGTNGCDTPTGWKQYVDASEQANKTTVTPSVELRNVRRSKSMLEGAARRMASISDGSEKSRFSKEQLIGMMREIGALQESIASLSKTVTMVMSREMAAGKTA